MTKRTAIRYEGEGTTHIRSIEIKREGGLDGSLKIDFALVLNCSHFQQRKGDEEMGRKKRRKECAWRTFLMDCARALAAANCNEMR